MFSSDLTKCIDLYQNAISFTNITCLILLLLDLWNKNNGLMESLLLLSAVYGKTCILWWQIYFYHKSFLWCKVYNGIIWFLKMRYNDENRYSYQIVLNLITKLSILNHVYFIFRVQTTMYVEGPGIDYIKHFGGGGQYVQKSKYIFYTSRIYFSNATVCSRWLIATNFLLYYLKSNI